MVLHVGRTIPLYRMGYQESLEVRLLRPRRRDSRDPYLARTVPAASVLLDMLPELLVLIAFEFNEVLVDHEALVDSNGPRLRIRLGIFQRQVNLQMVVRRTADSFSELCLFGIRAAVHVNPAVKGAVLRAPQVVGLNNQRVAVPMADGVAIPPRLQL